MAGNLEIVFEVEPELRISFRRKAERALQSRNVHSFDLAHGGCEIGNGK